MAELEATYENKEHNIRNGWRNTLDVEKDIKLGRVIGHADWWMNDGLISSYHATIRWDGNLLHVQERTDPPPTNRIYYQSRPQATFALPPGESFVIGNTVFLLHGEGSVASQFDRPEETIPAEASYSRAELRKVPFDDTSTFMRSLEQVPDALRMASDQDSLFRSMVKVCMDALPYADAVAIIEIPEDATETDRRVTVRTHLQRLAGKGKEFLPSRRLAHKALRDTKRSVLHVWLNTDRSDNMTIRVDNMPGTPWAICTPFRDDPNWGLYVDGRTEKDPEVVKQQVRDKRLLDYQKVIELISSLIENTRKAHELERNLAVYRNFLPRRLRVDTNSEQLEQMLEPRTTPVTVLFCDLRGSCQFSESGADSPESLKDAWDGLAAAMDDMTQCITSEEGIVAGFQGDAVMAFWGWPDNQPDQIERAARAALRIRSRFGKDGWWRELRCGIGIAHGLAVAGRLGAFDLAKVDVFGPTVNLASRLESLTKRFGVDILVDEAVANHLAKQPAQKWSRGRIRKLGRYVPAGMSRPLSMAEILPAENEPGQRVVREPQRRSWDEAIDWFLAGEWSMVRSRLENYFPDDPAARQIMNFMSSHNDLPPSDWAEKPQIVITTKT